MRASVALAALVLVWPSLALAQVPAEAGSGGGYDHALAPTANASRATADISVDGVLDESDWRSASPITELRQTVPIEGAAVSEVTDVRIVYDEDALSTAHAMVLPWSSGAAPPEAAGE